LPAINSMRPTTVSVSATSFSYGGGEISVKRLRLTELACPAIEDHDCNQHVAYRDTASTNADTGNEEDSGRESRPNGFGFASLQWKPGRIG
jgi:hypothetical protein